MQKGGPRSLKKQVKAMQELKVVLHKLRRTMLNSESNRY